MKITKSHLRKIIKEEIGRITEAYPPGPRNRPLRDLSSRLAGNLTFPPNDDDDDDDDETEEFGPDDDTQTDYHRNRDVRPPPWDSERLDDWYDEADAEELYVDPDTEEVPILEDDDEPAYPAPAGEDQYQVVEAFNSIDVAVDTVRALLRAVKEEEFQFSRDSSYTLADLYSKMNQLNMAWDSLKDTQ